MNRIVNFFRNSTDRRNVARASCRSENIPSDSAVSAAFLELPREIAGLAVMPVLSTVSSYVVLDYAIPFIERCFSCSDSSHERDNTLTRGSYRKPRSILKADHRRSRQTTLSAREFGGENRDGDERKTLRQMRNQCVNDCSECFRSHRVPRVKRKSETQSFISLWRYLNLYDDACPLIKNYFNFFFCLENFVFNSQSTYY